MKSRRPSHLNPRLAKMHRNYTVEEIARLFGVHKNTVRQWVRSGLPMVDRKRPFLILGADLAAFLAARRAQRRRPCGPGQMYCLRCREARTPLGHVAFYEPQTALLGNLRGKCPECGSTLNRRTSAAKLMEIGRHFDLKIPPGLQHIDESAVPTLNSDMRA